MSMRKFILKWLTITIAIWGLVFISYWLNRDHIEQLIAAGIALSFTHKIAYAAGHYEWWIFAIAAIFGFALAKLSPD